MAKIEKQRAAGSPFISAQQVADLAGVSRSAVSRTFTDGASVSEATRQRVLKAAETLGYHVNHLARVLMQEKSGIVSLVATDVATPYQARMIDALTYRLQASGKVAMIINTSSDSESVEAALRQTLNYRADATIVLSGQPPHTLIETCVANGQHVILINRDGDDPGSQSILLANQTAVREAFFMLQRAGCRNILVVASDVGTPSITIRERGFVAAAQEGGVAVTVKRLGTSSYASGAEIARLVLAGSAPPDGVFCVNDLMACGFMDVARHKFGLDVPADLCVIGFDDIEQAGWDSYELTTFRQPIDAISDCVVDLINEGADPGPARTPVTFSLEPVWRNSVRARPLS